MVSTGVLMEYWRANGQGRTEATPVAKALSEFLKASGLAEALANKAIRDTWKETVGSEVCQHTRVAGVRRQVLIIEVDSAPWLNELAGFYKDTLLREVQRRLPREGIRDIQFKAGSF